MSHSIHIGQLHLYFGKNHVLKNINLNIPSQAVTALIGPSGCGKSTLLRSINRMHDFTPDARIQGVIHVEGVNVHDRKVQVHRLRSQVGMVFQRPNPFPKSIYDNVAYGLGINGYPRSEIPGRVEQALIDSFLFDEVKDKLHEPALSLSGGQQQRLCIARTIAIEPQIILMDEPCSSLDPISTARIEDLIVSLKRAYTLVLVTHNMQQAQRVADWTAFMYLGELIEFGPTQQVFKQPECPLTRDYVNGHFG